MLDIARQATFLSIQAQDFIEEISAIRVYLIQTVRFLSIQAQDFIEDIMMACEKLDISIPEHSSSGLH